MTDKKPEKKIIPVSYALLETLQDEVFEDPRAALVRADLDRRRGERERLSAADLARKLAEMLDEALHALWADLVDAGLEYECEHAVRQVRRQATPYLAHLRKEYAGGTDSAIALTATELIDYWGGRCGALRRDAYAEALQYATDAELAASQSVRHFREQLLKERDRTVDQALARRESRPEVEMSVDEQGRTVVTTPEAVFQEFLGLKDVAEAKRQRDARGRELPETREP